MELINFISRVFGLPRLFRFFWPRISKRVAMIFFLIISETTDSTSVQETSLEMIKISMISSSTSTTEVPTQQTDHTIANDLESLPMDDQPVSLSQIHLDVPLED